MPRRVNNIPSEGILTDLYVHQGLSAAVVAEHLGLSEYFVYGCLKRFGLTRSAGSQTNDPHFDNLLPARSIRVAIPAGKTNYHSNIHKKARIRGFKVSIRKMDESTVSVKRLPDRRSPDDLRVGEIKRLYYREKWKVRRIAEALGISRTHVYRIMRDSGIQLKDRGKRDPVRPIARYELDRLYSRERLSVPEIAARLDVTQNDVARELDRHRIWPGARVPTRLDFPELANLPLWSDFIRESVRSPASTKLLRESKWFNVRILVDKVKDGEYRITRLPHLDRAVVWQLLGEGLSRTQIAKKLRADPKTIKHLFPK